MTEGKAVLLQVYKRGNWWFVEGSEGKFSSEDQANKAADVMRRYQPVKTTGSPDTKEVVTKETAPVATEVRAPEGAGILTKPFEDYLKLPSKRGGQGTQKEFSEFEEASAYAIELARKIGSYISVHRIETGWVVTQQNALTGEQPMLGAGP